MQATTTHARLVARTLSLLVLGWFGPSLTAAEPLRWQFAPGQAFNFYVNQSMVLKTGERGEITTTVVQRIDMTWDVQAVSDDGVATIRASIGRLQISMDTPPSSQLAYDSLADRPPVGMEAMLAETYDAMAKAKYEITLTPRGEVRGVTLPDELMETIKHRPGADGESGETVATAIKAMITQGVFILPEEPPNVGDEWSDSAKVADPAFGDGTVETTYRYAGTRDIDGTTYVAIRPTVRLEFAGHNTHILAMKEQKTSGEYLFDPAAGRLRSMAYEQQATLDLTHGGQTVPGTIQQKVEVMVAGK